MESLLVKNNIFKLVNGPNLKPNSNDWFIILDPNLFNKRKFLASQRNQMSARVLTSEELISIINSCNNSKEEKSMMILKIFGDEK